MQADQSGTPSEQVRHAAGWLTPTEAKARTVANRCRGCSHYRPAYLHDGPDFSKAGGRCDHLGIASKPWATCAHWEARP